MTPKVIEKKKKHNAVDIGHEMNLAGLPEGFVNSAVKTALDYEETLELMVMWLEETDKDERDDIIADIQEMIEDCEHKGKVEGVYIPFDDLERIGKDIRAFKNSLRLIVEDNGGIKKLSELTGIPQPSLSRFFNSAAMPRRTTLLKIARALNLSDVQIATPWSH